MSSLTPAGKNELAAVLIEARALLSAPHTSRELTAMRARVKQFIDLIPGVRETLRELADARAAIEHRAKLAAQNPAMTRRALPGGPSNAA